MRRTVRITLDLAEDALLPARDEIITTDHVRALKGRELHGRPALPGAPEHNYAATAA